MILKAENRHLIEMMTYYGVTDIILGDEKDNPPPEDKEEPKPPDDDDHEDDIPPRQMGLWD